MTRLQLATEVALDQFRVNGATVTEAQVRDALAQVLMALDADDDRPSMDREQMWRPSDGQVRS